MGFQEIPLLSQWFLVDSIETSAIHHSIYYIFQKKKCVLRKSKFKNRKFLQFFGFEKLQNIQINLHIVIQL